MESPPSLIPGRPKDLQISHSLARIFLVGHFVVRRSRTLKTKVFALFRLLVPGHRPLAIWLTVSVMAYSQTQIAVGSILKRITNTRAKSCDCCYSTRAFSHASANHLNVTNQ